VYSIYSGGDDLFFVGSWDALPELAREIRRDLTRFAAEHPGIHASGGIALVGGKYPLYQAARDAKEAEDQAKGLRWRAREAEAEQERTKDALAFLGQALPWERFGTGPCEEPGIETAHALMHLLSSMMKADGRDGKGAPQALLRRLLGLYEQYEEAGRVRREAGEDQNRAGQPQVLWGPWMWRGFYTLTRMADQRKSEGEVRAQIRELRDQLKRDQFASMEWIGLAARWAELYLR
jgi:CRISPR-associated protein Csm1